MGGSGLKENLRVDEPQRSGGTERQLGHERVANEELLERSLRGRCYYLSDVNREGQLASFTSKQATSQRFLWQENQIIKVDGDVRLLLLTRPSSVCYLSKCRVG